MNRSGCFFANSVPLLQHFLISLRPNDITHSGRVTHICVNKLTIIGSDNGLSPGRRQAIIWTNAGILLIEPLGTNFSEILIGIQMFSFKKMRLKMSSAKWGPFCLSLNVINMHANRAFISSVARVGAGQLSEPSLDYFPLNYMYGI